MKRKINLDPKDLNKFINFYSACLSMGFVKVERDNYQNVNILRISATRFEHYLEDIPFKVGSICWISPKISINVLETIKMAKKDDSDFMQIQLIKNKNLKIRTYNIKHKKLHKYNCKLWTINFK